MSQPRRPRGTAASPRKHDAEATRQRLLAAAERLFVAKGFEGTRVDEIAAVARVNKRMLYVYFGNKEAAYAEVLRRVYERIIAVQREVVDPALGPAEQAEAAIRRYFEFVAANPSYVRLMEWEGLSPHSEAEHAKILASGLESLHAVCEQGVRTGIFRADVDFHKLVISVNALCVGVFSRRVLVESLWGADLRSPDVQRELLDHIVALVLRGVLARPGDRR